MDLFVTHVSDESKKLLLEVLDSTFLNEGKMVAKFEEELHNILGLNNVLTTNSCTSSLHLALEACNVRGKEVVLPAQTFIATGLAIMMAGATPVFCDVDIDGNVNPGTLAGKLTPNTAAVIVVHWAGNPCRIHEIKNVVGDIPVIEDAAHALGAEIDGVPIGAVGPDYPSDYVCFSFQSIKHCPAGDMGAVCVKDMNKYDEILKRKWFGINKKALKRTPEGDRDCNVNLLGYKYHANDVAAAIGLGNLRDFKGRLEQRRANARILKAGLSEVPNLSPVLSYTPKANHAYWIFPITVWGRINFIEKMKQEGIPVSVIDRRIDRHDIFGGMRHELFWQCLFDHTQVNLPVHEQLTKDDLSRIIEVVKKYEYVS